MNPRPALFLTVATGILFAGSYVAAEFTTRDLEPLTTSLLRYLVALLFLATLGRWVTGSPFRVRARDLPTLILLGLFGIVGYHYFLFLSLRYTEVANTAIVNALSPLVTAVLAAKSGIVIISGWPHDLMGFLMFAVSLGILLAWRKALRWVESRRLASPASS